MLPVFTSHYLCAVENAFPFMEYSIEDDHWTDNVVMNMPVAHNGKFTPSESAGWGVSINPDWLKKAEYKVTK